MEGLWLDGTGLPVDLVRLEWVSRAGMRSVLFRDARGSGLCVADGFDLHFWDVLWESCGGDGRSWAFDCMGTDSDSNVNNLWFIGCRWENTAIKPGGGLLRIDGSGMSTRSGKHRFVSCKFHGNPIPEQRADVPHVSLAQCKEVVFAGVEFSKTNGSFVDMDRCHVIRFSGLDTMGGGHDSGYQFVVRSSSDISFDGTSFYDVQEAFLQVDAGSRNVYLSPTCRYGAAGPGGIVEDAGNAVWVALQEGNAVRVQDRVIDEVRTLPDGSSRPSVADGHLFRTSNSSPTGIRALRDGTAGQRVVLQAADDQTRLVHGDGLTLRGASSRKLDRGELVELVSMEPGRWSEL